MSTHIAIQDQGSNGWQSNGTANVPAGTVPTYALSVGGTSASTPYSAANDVTLSRYYQLAMQGDMATIFELVEAGLMTLPSKLSTANPAILTAGAPRGETYAGELTQLIETVWNEYVFVPHGNELHVGFTSNDATSGGVDPTQPVPRYQSAIGLAPGATPQAPNGNGRGAPDVSALAGGNAYYAVLNSNYIGNLKGPVVTGDIGTSSAAPLPGRPWRSSSTPSSPTRSCGGLGSMTDLLYIATVIAPAAFDDVTIGGRCRP